MPNCGYCGHNRDGMPSTNGLNFCNQCITDGFALACRVCGLVFLNDSAPRRDGLCEHCLQYLVCTGCGACFADDSNCDRLCTLCERRSAGRTVGNHSYMPQRMMYLVAKGEVRHPDTLFFGVEIEVENVMSIVRNDDAAAQLVRDCRGAVYIKHDGSLNNGFEIVTHPFTWGWLNSKEGQAALKPIWALREKGFRGFDTTTAGMHVHMTKAAFSRVQLYRFLQLHYGNPDMVHLVSRRKSAGSLSQWAKTTWSGERDYYGAEGETVAKAAMHKQRNSDRYHAVNLTNQRTVEVRIFRSTVRYAGFLQRIQWCKAAFDYTLECSIADARDANKFMAWLKKHRNEYRALAKFMIDEQGEKALEIAKSRRQRVGSKGHNSDRGLVLRLARTTQREVDIEREGVPGRRVLRAEPLAARAEAETDLSSVQEMSQHPPLRLRRRSTVPPVVTFDRLTGRYNIHNPANDPR